MCVYIYIYIYTYICIYSKIESLTGCVGPAVFAISSGPVFMINTRAQREFLYS